MTIHYKKLIEIVAELCDKRNLQAAVTESVKGGIIAGVSAAVGGILLGPIGLALGGVIGGATAAATSKPFKPVAQILLELPAEKQRELALKLKSAFKDFNVTDVAALSSLLLWNRSLQDLAVREVTNYLQNNLSMSVQSR